MLTVYALTQAVLAGPPQNFILPVEAYVAAICAAESGREPVGSGARGRGRPRGLTTSAKVPTARVAGEGYHVGQGLPCCP